jgi:hypothetical protein
MTDFNGYLMSLARDVADVYTTRTGAIAIMVAGSIAERLCDQYSDLDLIAYYDELPAETVIAAARDALGAGTTRPIGGSREEGSYAETFDLRGVDCQLGYATVAAWERDIDSVLVGLDVDSPIQKALAGTLSGVALHGDDLVQGWKTRLADYPDALAHAMVVRHLRFFPLWGLEGRLEARDATIWRFQALTEAAFNLLGVLAGLNRLYFTSFQFKRMRAFVDQMGVAPVNLASRIERLFAPGDSAAALELERLVTETVDLVEREMPDVDTSRVRARLGWRQPPIRVVEG